MLTVSFDGRVRVVTVLRSAAALLLVADSYLRTVFVLVGAALALALGIVDFTVLSLVATAGVPAWATALIGVVLVGGPLLVGVVPAVRQVEGVAAQTLLAVEFQDGPPGAATGWPQRRANDGVVPCALVHGCPCRRRGAGADRASRQLVDAPGSGGDVGGHVAGRPAGLTLPRSCWDRPTLSGSSASRLMPPEPPSATGSLAKSTTASGTRCP